MNIDLLNKEDKLLTEDKFVVIGCSSEVGNNIIYERFNYKKLAWMKFKKNTAAVISVFLLMFLLIVSFSSPIWAADKFYTIEDANNMTTGTDEEKEVFLNDISSTQLLKKDSELVNSPPDSQHYFGTDEQGIDIFANTFVRIRLSILLGLAVSLLNTFIGIIYGSISGYMGGIVDDIMMRIVEIMCSIPSLIWIFVVVLILGNSLTSVIIAMSIFGWGKTAIIIRGKVYELKEQEFIVASKALGADYERIVIGHLFPNILPLAFSAFTNDISTAIIDETFLAFMGLGIMFPYYTVGTMMSLYIKSGVILFYPYQIILPTMVIGLVLLFMQLISNGISDALDPKIIY